MVGFIAICFNGDDMVIINGRQAVIVMVGSGTHYTDADSGTTGREKLQGHLSSQKVKS